MRTALIILVAVAGALAGRFIGVTRFGGTAQAASTNGPERSALRAKIETLRDKNRDLERTLAERERATEMIAAVPPEAHIGETELAVAVERWLAANPGRQHEPDPAQEPMAWLGGDAVDLANVSIEDLVRTLASSSLTDDDRQELFESLRQAGRMDEYVAAIEKLAEENPESAEAQVALGQAYLQKLFGIGATPEGGQYAFKSDAAFDRALEIDEYNWQARFVKAVSLSNWPAFLGRGPDAIENFEILIQQQEGMAPQPEFAMTYLFLGNVYQSGGQSEDALETWKDGLALFPEDEDLLRAVENATPH